MNSKGKKQVRRHATKAKRQSFKALLELTSANSNAVERCCTFVSRRAEALSVYGHCALQVLERQCGTLLVAGGQWLNGVRPPVVVAAGCCVLAVLCE